MSNYDIIISVKYLGNMKYYLWIIGCQYNEWDGARLKYFLDQNGFIETPANDADVIIILACSVRQTAVDRILGRVKNWIPRSDVRRDYAGQASKTILVTGCVLDIDKEKFAKKGIKIFEPGDFKALKKYLDIKLKKSRRFGNVGIPIGYAASGLKSCSYVPIMIGCNNFCSYCAVPYVRGREKSRKVDEVINDVKNLVKNGQKDIMLLGQNVNSYKSQSSNLKAQTYNSKLKNKKTDFTELLERLNSLEGNFRIGFISNHPKDMSDDIIEAVAKLPKIKKEIHLPLQSGSDKILKAMNRPYTAKQYLKIINKIKKANPSIRITTDVIVGFPGETENDFQKTVEIFKKIKFAQAYINKYSPRAGTVAYKLGDPIIWSEKQRRWRILNDIANK